MRAGAYADRVLPEKHAVGRVFRILVRDLGQDQLIVYLPDILAGLKPYALAALEHDIFLRKSGEALFRLAPAHALKHFVHLAPRAADALNTVRQNKLVDKAALCKLLDGLSGKLRTQPRDGLVHALDAEHFLLDIRRDYEKSLVAAYVKVQPVRIVAVIALKIYLFIVIRGRIIYFFKRFVFHKQNLSSKFDKLLHFSSRNPKFPPRIWNYILNNSLLAPKKQANLALKRKMPVGYSPPAFGIFA